MRGPPGTDVNYERWNHGGARLPAAQRDSEVILTATIGRHERSRTSLDRSYVSGGRTLRCETSKVAPGRRMTYHDIYCGTSSAAGLLTSSCESNNIMATASRVSLSVHGVGWRGWMRTPARECPRTRGGDWRRGTEVTAATCRLGRSVRSIALRTFLRRFYRGCACRVSPETEQWHAPVRECTVEADTLNHDR